MRTTTNGEKGKIVLVQSMVPEENAQKIERAINCLPGMRDFAPGHHHSKRFVANSWCELVPLLALRSLTGARQTD